jgi:hypothetical protein
MDDLESGSGLQLTAISRAPETSMNPGKIKMMPADASVSKQKWPLEAKARARKETRKAMAIWRRGDDQSTCEEVEKVERTDFESRRHDRVKNDELDLTEPHQTAK